jgi:hypothetical protein
MDSPVLLPLCKSPPTIVVDKPPPIRLTLARTTATAMALTLGQVLFVLALAPDESAGKYQALCRWDGWMYANVAERGYHSTVPVVAHNLDVSNVAVFPAYPFVAGAISRIIRVSTPTALLLTSQIAAWGFWSYWLLFFVRWRAPTWLTAIATMTAVVHPAAYFLVVSYSESLFLVGVLGYLYWATSKVQRSRYLSVPHGVLMTATRLGGLPVALCPWLASSIGDGLFRSTRDRFEYRSPWFVHLGIIGMVASLGCFGFFVYCQWQFGAWDIYMQSQQAGWHVSADWLWWLRPVNYFCFGSTLYPNALWTDDLSRFTVLLTIGMFLLLGCWEYRLAAEHETFWRGRLVFYFAAAVLFFLHAAGVSPILMKSMVRYCLGTHVLLLLAVGHLVAHVPSTVSSPRRLRWRMCAICGGLACLQSVILWHFLRDFWVA